MALRSPHKPKSQKEHKRHPHFIVTCGCGQEFGMCGLPCFIFCPNCQTCLILKNVPVK